MATQNTLTYMQSSSALIVVHEQGLQVIVFLRQKSNYMNRAQAWVALEFPLYHVVTVCSTLIIYIMPGLVSWIALNSVRDFLFHHNFINIYSFQKRFFFCTANGGFGKIVLVHMCFFALHEVLVLSLCSHWNQFWLWTKAERWNTDEMEKKIKTHFQHPHRCMET